MASAGRTFRRVVAAGWPTIAVLAATAGPAARRALLVRGAGRRPCGGSDRRRAAFASVTAAKSSSPASSRLSPGATRAERAAALVGHDRGQGRRPCAARTTRPTAMAGKPPSSFSPARTRRCKASCLRRARRWLPPTSPTRSALPLCRRPRPPREAAKKGIWNSPAVIKNAESTDDILAGIGRFLLVEGRVLSVRQAGATTYLNFGRRWTRDFAVTISRRNMPAVESAGVALKSLENRRIRVRGWVEARPGPRIEVVRAGQIEVLGGN